MKFYTMIFSEIVEYAKTYIVSDVQFLIKFEKNTYVYSDQRE